MHRVVTQQIEARVSLAEHFLRPELPYMGDAYTSVVRSVSRDMIAGVANILGGTFSSEVLDRFSLATVGSDSREENLPSTSDLELVVFSTVEMKEIIDALAAFLGDHVHISDSKLIDGPEHRMTYFQDKASFPSRIIDARYIVGNRDLLATAKTRAEQEIIDDNSMFEREKARRSEYAQVCGKALSTGLGTQRFKGADVVHFDINEGFADFDPEKGTYAFKYGPIRLLQTRLTLAIMKIIRALKQPGSFLHTVPANIGDRMQFLLDEKKTKLTLNEVRDLKDCYYYFVWLYHRSRVNFKDSQTNRLSIDSQTARERIDCIVRLGDRDLTI